MPSTPHGAKALTDLQTRYTANTATVAALKAAGVSSASAAQAATAADLQLAVGREAQTPLT